MCKGLGVGEQRATPTCICDPTMDARKVCWRGRDLRIQGPQVSKGPRPREDQRREDHTARTQQSRATNPPVRSGVGAGRRCRREDAAAGEGRRWGQGQRGGLEWAGRRWDVGGRGLWLLERERLCTSGPAAEVSWAYSAVFPPQALSGDRNEAGTWALVCPSSSELLSLLG